MCKNLNSLYFWVLFYVVGNIVNWRIYSQDFSSISARTKGPSLLRIAKVYLWNKCIILNLFKIAMVFYMVGNIVNRRIYSQDFSSISARTKGPSLLRIAKVYLWNKCIILNLFKIAMVFYVVKILWKDIRCGRISRFNASIFYKILLGG